MSLRPFLTIPVEGLVSASGKLLKADARLLQLHFDAGGEDQGDLAIPGLAAIAAFVSRSAIRIERRVRVASQDHDIDLWVEALPEGGMVRLRLTGWRERALIQPEVYEPIQPDDTLLLSDAFLILRAPADLDDEGRLIGRHFASEFVLTDGGEGNMPMLDLLAKRARISDVGVSLLDGTQNFLLNLAPQNGLDGAFVGYSGKLSPIVAPLTDTVDSGQAEGLGFGKQFAPILRQPLSRIIANAETIQSRLRGPLREAYASYAQDIANAARHLAELVTDLEDLEAIDRADFSVAADSVDLVDIARRVSGLLALKAADNQMVIAVDGESDVTPVIGEFRRVLQIVLNLVMNAIRYGPGGSTVTITTGGDGVQGWIEVQDAGKGIDPADADRIFEKFERLGRTGDGGSGLGLYISRRLARFMHGDLVLMPSTGQGARFRLTLPVKIA